MVSGNRYNRSFATDSHMVQNPPCWKASCALEQKKNKQKNSSLTGWNRFVLKAVTIICPPAWWTLYHVTVCCKRPIDVQSFRSFMAMFQNTCCSFYTFSLAAKDMLNTCPLNTGSYYRKYRENVRDLLRSLSA